MMDGDVLEYTVKGAAYYMASPGTPDQQPSSHG